MKGKEEEAEKSVEVLCKKDMSVMTDKECTVRQDFTRARHLRNLPTHCDEASWEGAMARDSVKSSTDNKRKRAAEAGPLVKPKSFKPLTSWGGSGSNGNGSSNAARAESESKASPSVKKVKTASSRSTTQSPLKKAVTAGQTIELLSSGDEAIDEPEVIEGDSSEGEDSATILPQPSGRDPLGQSAPRERLVCKTTSTSRITQAKQEESMPALSNKAKGKRKAVEKDGPEAELEIQDHAPGAPRLSPVLSAIAYR